MADIVPLSERGLYQGIVVIVWAVASGIGPPVVRGDRFVQCILLTILQGGSLAEKASWRWLFCTYSQLDT